MHKSHIRPWLVAVVALGSVAATTTLATTAGAAEAVNRVSESSTGEQANGLSVGAVVSGSGRFVAFTSSATNLAANDTDDRPDVYIRDLTTGTTELVSVGTTLSATGGTLNDVSLDGRYVVFESTAADLVANDFNGVSDVFIRDRVAGTTERVSLADDDAQASQRSFDASVSKDGRFVAFSSFAPLTDADRDSSSQDVYIRDRVAGTTELVSVSRKGFEAGGQAPSLNDNGRFVSFTSQSRDVVKNDKNKAQDIFVRDLRNDKTTRVSVSSKGEEAGKSSFESQMAGAGRYVVFTSAAGNLVKKDKNKRIDVFVHDRKSDKTELASLDGDRQIKGSSVSPTISADGRYVLFSAGANTGSTGGGLDTLYLRDRSTGRTRLVVGNVSQGGVVSGDGHAVSFFAVRPDVKTPDVNNTFDVFVYTW